jgi:hypothetical protein
VSAAIKAFLSNLLLIPVTEDENDRGTRRRGRKRDKKTVITQKQFDLGDTATNHGTEPTPSVTHWIDDARARRRFWAWCGQTLSLSDSDVYTALDVDDIHKYAGTMHEAQAAINAYVARKATQNERTDSDEHTADV